MTSLRHALAFLTRLPGGAHPQGAGAGQAMTAAVPWFPVVGLVVGAIGAAVYLGLSTVLAPLPAAALAFAATALVTGGFHEDGLADSFDALSGGWDREDRLRILKDSRHGTFGVLSLVLVTVIKVSALAELGGWDAALALGSAHIAGRGGAVGLMGVAPTASETGLGADYTRGLRPLPAALGALLGVASLVVAFRADAVVVLLMLALCVAAVGVWARRRIGGVTGDILGAAEQVGECAVLLCATAFV